MVLKLKWFVEFIKAKLKTRRLTMSDIAEAVGKRIYASNIKAHEP